MREIKFRGKSKKDGKWLYGYLGESKFKILNTEYSEKVIFDNVWEFNSDNCAFIVKDLAVDPETIGQFTGLKTKDEKDIWEGDILKIKEYDNLGILAFSGEELKVFSLQDLKGNLRGEWNDEIKCENASFFVGDMWLDGLFGDMRCSCPIYEFEVIGNRWDNPELLEETK